MDRSLPGWIHLVAGLHDVAHHDGFNLVGVKVRTRDRGSNRHRAESGS
jgi:hypothetical protein